MSVIAPAQSEDGFTLVEVLVAASLMIIVLGAILTPFTAFTNTTKRTFDFNEQQDRVRNTLDQVIRQARNLANPTTGGAGAAPTTIAYADSTRFVFQTSDPQKQWVSYCLDDQTNASRENIWYQTSTNNSLGPAAVRAGTMVGPACPAVNANWQTLTQVADYVTNDKNSASIRPLFTYYNLSGPFTASNLPVALSSTSTIVRVGMSIYLQIKPGKAPGETQLESVAWMRNQNQAPTSKFVTSLSGTTYTFDGGDASDPEGRTLIYDWYTAPVNASMTMPATDSLPSCGAANPVFPASASGWACLGTTVVVSSSSLSNKYVFLRVTDPGSLQSISSFPTSGGCPSATTRAETVCGAV